MYKLQNRNRYIRDKIQQKWRPEQISGYAKKHQLFSIGLIRQYLKKGSSFGNVTDYDLEIIADELNNRPRKILGYATPNETFI
jgi:IS30 family transposase